MLPHILWLAILLKCSALGLNSDGSQPISSPTFKNEDSLESVDGYLDSINYKDWTAPDAKLIYNYEQIRQNEPSLIEQREEDLHKYMTRNPLTTTTTTTAAPVADRKVKHKSKSSGIHGVFDTAFIVLDSSRHHQHHHHHHQHQSSSTAAPIPNVPEKQEVLPMQPPQLPNNSWDNGKYQSAFPATMPPPPALPNLKDVKKLIEHDSRPQHQAKPHHTSHKAAHKLELPEAPMKIVLYSNLEPKHRHIPHHIKNQDNGSITTIQPALAKIKHSHPSGHLKPGSHVHRGNHKFRDDVTLAPLTTTTSSTNIVKRSQNSNPPPPVPTLSPWYDNYGK